MIVFACHVCGTSLSAEDAQAGQLVRCPSCMTALRAPASEPGAAGAQTAPPIPGRIAGMKTGGKAYGFNCPYCSSRLEANEAMAAQDGQCPTCGNNITIPILDRYNRLIDPKTRQIIKQDPHPVHAYAAAGERAPVIERSENGSQIIRCPGCQAANAITANNCKVCGKPFTLEGTTLEAAGGTNGFCVTSLVLGIIGLIPCAYGVFLGAIIFGIIGYNQVVKIGSEGRGKGMAIAGIILGVIGGLVEVLFVMR